jgi:hypothetical protein
MPRKNPDHEEEYIMSLRLPAGVVEALRDQANQHTRNLHQQVVHILREYLETQGYTDLPWKEAPRRRTRQTPQETPTPQD